MGRAKDAWMAAQEQGWEAPETFVCADCVEDNYLKGIITAAATASGCDYCGKQDNIDFAAPVESLMPAIMGGLHHYFADPTDAGVPYETAEGGWLIQPISTEDALYTLPLECNEKLFDDIASAIDNDAWVVAAQGSWVLEQENARLIGAWRGFEEHVKHRQRYFFTDPQPQNGPDIDPSLLMPVIGGVVSELELVTKLTPKTPLYRVRLRGQSDSWPLDAANLGAPPKKKVAAGRMNPPGIPYLYLALERETAIAEVTHGPPTGFAIAEFRAKKKLTVLDLTLLPKIPSMFEVERLQERESLLFLHEFVQNITQPVVKDGSEHVEYVPTQIVCEYFASVFKKRSLDGILYPSAVQVGGKNLVIFPREEENNAFPQVVFRAAEEVSARNWSTLMALLSNGT